MTILGILTHLLVWSLSGHCCCRCCCRTFSRMSGWSRFRLSTLLCLCTHTHSLTGKWLLVVVWQMTLVDRRRAVSFYSRRGPTPFFYPLRQVSSFDTCKCVRLWGVRVGQQCDSDYDRNEVAVPSVQLIICAISAERPCMLSSSSDSTAWHCWRLVHLLLLFGYHLPLINCFTATVSVSLFVFRGHLIASVIASQPTTFSHWAHPFFSVSPRTLLCFCGVGKWKKSGHDT